MSENTVLITGGGSGIGRGLAEAFYRLGNQVIIAGRRQVVLDQVAAANPGMRTIQLDIDNPDAVKEFGKKFAVEFPGLNVLINNAGIQRVENLLAQPPDLETIQATFTTNLLGPIRVTAALLPLLIRQEQSTIINVTSGLAFVPGSAVPSYCASKAAMHSYTLSLRQQLRNTTTAVIELIPPYVQTDLGPSHGNDPRAMKLSDFVDEAMMIILKDPTTTEIVVERCRHLRFAAETGTFDATFKWLNNGMA
ncbi:SDR family oxidoreductase [Collimonas sp. OK242]|uniref:SDR family oxidoreductase n=1 Tax=Collimonas sp. OK242 TaxID=1798195 RepID=UPI001C40933F|nr:SDR family NAD(P)-dependent oxidoreductase [Collimonas sp. OK242]